MKNLSIELGALVKTLNEKGIKYELTGNHTNIFWIGNAPYDNDETFAIELGISLKSGIWIWLTVRGMEDGCANEYWFRQRYNQNNGKTLRSWRTGVKCIEAIEKAAGVELRKYVND